MQTHSKYSRISELRGFCLINKHDLVLSCNQVGGLYVSKAGQSSDSIPLLNNVKVTEDKLGNDLALRPVANCDEMMGAMEMK